MKLIAILSLSTAVKAQNNNHHNHCRLPSQTRASGCTGCMPLTFDRKYIMGSDGGTSCYHNTGSSIEDVGSAQQCAVKCTEKGNMSEILPLHGFDYHCRTKECVCVYGTKWELENMNDKVQRDSDANKACYGLQKSTSLDLEAQYSDFGKQAISASSIYTTDANQDGNKDDPSSTADDTNEDGAEKAADWTRKAASETADGAKKAAEETADGAKKAFDDAKEFGKDTFGNSSTAVNPTSLFAALFGILATQLV